ncbi:MAG: type II toxin-antitoxin system death-on-curing family toxin [Actinobacteria bacterium]|nr:type II toxin-antitoxin system death-on-curing family toxin [Actinomycetota bacterium]
MTVADALFIHAVLLDRHGGSPGLRDHGALESALVRPQMGYYDDLIAEDAALFESLAINHPFIDGNKRVAFGAVDVFLRTNGYRLTVTSDQAYAFMIDLFETNRFRFEHLEPWLRSIAKPATD